MARLYIQVWQLTKGTNEGIPVAAFALPSDAQAWAQFARENWPLVDFEIRKED